MNGYNLVVTFIFVDVYSNNNLKWPFSLAKVSKCQWKIFKIELNFTDVIEISFFLKFKLNNITYALNNFIWRSIAMIFNGKG